MNNNISRARVKVLLAAYNGADWIVPQVESILAQQGVDVSVVIADDHSRDATLQVLHERFAHEPRVTVLARAQGSGSAGANFRNMYRETDVRDVDFVALADQDDVWNADKLARAVMRLDADGADGYSSAVTAVWQGGAAKILQQHPTPTAADHLFEGAGQGCTFVMRGEFFVSVQDFCRKNHDAVEQMHYHDWLVYLLARAWQRHWSFDQQPSMTYRQHALNEIGARKGWSAIRHRLALIRNGWYRKQLAVASDIYLLADGRDDVACDLAGRLGGGQRRAGGLVDRIAMAIAVACHGRRRASDRGVLTLAALAGWF
jgi:rhamnosyltransferase